MSGWRQAVFVRQRRIEVIQRALSAVLDEESWSPATPRRLYIGAADASSRGWTMILPELANFFLDHGGLDRGAPSEPRLCRLARELHCPAYEVDVRDRVATTLYEVDVHGRLRISGAMPAAATALAGDDAAPSPIAGFGLIAVSDEIRDRIAELAVHPEARITALADYLGAVAGFPAWTRYADDPITAGELIYEPPRILARDPGGVVTRLSEAHAITHAAPRAPAAHDRRGRRPRSVSRTRR
ncbi:MAG: hypothetical protein E6J90_21040 [Deltaproteobacteria bacterium]|nr:MAG: hypothetical protein E6J91_25705 [Deltaproteobacteria bacterium]TMQ18082.1 MAG: hypothetical protein E6J90_21040 [Deltaproteobacteria bacterium]